MKVRFGAVDTPRRPAGRGAAAATPDRPRQDALHRLAKFIEAPDAPRANPADAIVTCFADFVEKSRVRSGTNPAHSEVSSPSHGLDVPDVWSPVYLFIRIALFGATSWTRGRGTGPGTGCSVCDSRGTTHAATTNELGNSLFYRT